jgi:hypothetical protein
MKRKLIGGAILLIGTGVAVAGLWDIIFIQVPFPKMSARVLAKAQPDECFVGLGSTNNVYDPSGAIIPCTNGVPKVNEAYVWGLTKADGKLWFGTAPNVHCFVFGSYLGMTNPEETVSSVCEYGMSQFARVYHLPAAGGDWRPPSIYSYDLTSRQLTRYRSDTLHDARLNATLGLRSAGANNGVVLLAGPTLVTGAGINLFAFNTQTSAYLGSTNLPQYSNIRKWVNADGVLYTAVRKTAGGGSVLRWSGSVTNPFILEVVGQLDNEGAELSMYGKHRLAISTWPGSGAPAGIYIGPAIPAGGLTAAATNKWRKVWSVTDYEPDSLTASTYGGGAAAYYSGWLYWGTMHVPLVASRANIITNGVPTNATQFAEILLNTHRAISIFRGRKLETDHPKIELLYGEQNLPAFNPATHQFESVPNNMGQKPKFGPSGFGNPFNNYTWTMGVSANSLFVGTMDWSYLFDDLANDMANLFSFSIPPSLLDQVQGITRLHGADLWRFDSANWVAVAESLDGIGNPTSYGVRSMVAEKKVMYIGMANPMNLVPGPEGGGWELIELRRGGH